MYPKSDGWEEDCSFSTMGMFAVHLLDFRGVLVVSFRTIPVLMILKMCGSDTRVQLSFTQLAIFVTKNCICINFPWNINMSHHRSMGIVYSPTLIPNNRRYVNIPYMNGMGVVFSYLHT